MMFETMQEQIKMQKEIREHGRLKLSNSASYWEHREQFHKKKKKVIPALMPVVNKADGKFSLRKSQKSQSFVIGDQPDGFGTGFKWGREDDEILLAVFINVADYLGVSIDGLYPGDVLKFCSGTGTASFTKDDGNPIASSLVGLVATGARIATSIAGFPEAVPLVDAAESFAKDQFKATNAHNAIRDVYGVEPGTGHKAKREGGIIICLPGSGGVFYSGDKDHRERWIQEPGDRMDKNMPKHVYSAFFPMRGMDAHNTRKINYDVQEPQQAYIVAWDDGQLDHFSDNAGYYKIFIHIK